MPRTEEERRAHKERERAERRAKEAATAKGGPPELSDSATRKEPALSAFTEKSKPSAKPSSAIDQLVAAVAEENRASALRSAPQLNKDNAVAAPSSSPAIVSSENGDGLKPPGEASAIGDSRKGQHNSERREQRKHKKLKSIEPNSLVTADGIEGDSTLSIMMDLQRQGYRSRFDKDMVRATMLRRLVDLDDTSVVLFDTAPQSEYDLYIRSFHESGKRQVWVQAPAEEDFVDAEIQVDRAHGKHRVVQVPDDLYLYSKRLTEKCDIRSGDAVNKTEAGDARGLTTALIPSVDSNLLLNFIYRVLPVMGAVLDSCLLDQRGGAGGAESVNKLIAGSTSLASFSYACTTYSFLGTSKRSVQKVRFSYASPHSVAALYGEAQESSCLPDLDRYPSVILVWSIFDNTEPEQILVSYSSLSCFCFSPSRPVLIYGGSENGSVCVWNLREPDRHHLYEGRHQRLVFRLPSYSTSWCTDQHCTPVRQVCVAGYNNVFGPKREEDEQLASLDSGGEVKFWAVSDKDTRSKTTINQNEHGMHIFSTIKLSMVGSSSQGGRSEMGSASNLSPSVPSSFPLAYSGGGWGATALDFTPTDASRYVVATPQGLAHRSRYGGITAPAAYGPRSHYFGQPTAVPCCVQYNLLDSRFLEAGYEDGTVRLFLHNKEAPQLTVAVANAGVPIIELRCSSTARWITLALDQAGTLHVLDHAHKNRDGPHFSFPLSQAGTGACFCMDTPPEERSSEKRLLALGFEKGMVQVHTLNAVNLQTPASDRDESWL